MWKVHGRALTLNSTHGHDLCSCEAYISMHEGASSIQAPAVTTYKTFSQPTRTYIPYGPATCDHNIHAYISVPYQPTHACHYPNVYYSANCELQQHSRKLKSDHVLP